MDTSTLSKINRFTRRHLSPDELYTFPVILCDNDIDRDGESFSDSALDSLAEKFIGKTGISDHQPSSSNQTARIYDAQVITDNERTTKYGKPYRCLKAFAYMVRTDDNRSLIAEIDAGIKKEVSISCAASKKICSVCGCYKTKSSCSHVRGKKYGGKLCFDILDGISDAYEWSFVAVPAQVGAGVTKKFSGGEKNSSPVVYDGIADEELRRDIRRLAFFSGGKTAADAASAAYPGMDTGQLIAMKKAYEKCLSSADTVIQLVPETEDVSAFEFTL